MPRNSKRERLYNQTRSSLLDKISKTNVPSLLSALLQGDEKLFEQILNNPEFNKKEAFKERYGEKYETIMHLAVAEENVRIVELLLQHGADFYVLNTDDEEKTPLFYAIKQASCNIVKVLLKDKSARLSANHLVKYKEWNERGEIDFNTTTIAHEVFTLRYGAKREIFEILINEKEINFGIAVSTGETPLINFLRNFNSKENDNEILKMLLKRQDVLATINAQRTYDGNTAANLILSRYSSFNYDEEMIKILVCCKEVDFSLANHYGVTPIRSAINENDLTIIMPLLTHPSVINQIYQKDLEAKSLLDYSTSINIAFVIILIQAQKGRIENSDNKIVKDAMHYILTYTLLIHFMEESKSSSLSEIQDIIQIMSKYLLKDYKEEEIKFIYNTVVNTSYETLKTILYENSLNDYIHNLSSEVINKLKEVASNIMIEEDNKITQLERIRRNERHYYNIISNSLSNIIPQLAIEPKFIYKTHKIFAENVAQEIISKPSTKINITTISKAVKDCVEKNYNLLNNTKSHL
jgi:ankyrin repeat protein